MTGLFHIWNDKHRAWLQQDGKNLTFYLKDAGVFLGMTAVSICCDATSEWNGVGHPPLALFPANITPR